LATSDFDVRLIGLVVGAQVIGLSAFVELLPVIPRGVVGRDATGGGVTGRDETDRWGQKDRPRLLGGVIAALPDSAVDDQFFDAQCEEAGEVVVVASTAALPDAVSSTAGWLVEIQRDLVAFSEWVVTDLASWFVFSRLCYA
jgi:hypothetical protein